jgi:hypothetical protein
MSPESGSDDDDEEDAVGVSNVRGGDVAAPPAVVDNPSSNPVDNPLVVFTADAPFRYVGCSGAQNEDDYEGH